MVVLWLWAALPNCTIIVTIELLLLLLMGEGRLFPYCYVLLMVLQLTVLCVCVWVRGWVGGCCVSRLAIVIMPIDCIRTTCSSYLNGEAIQPLLSTPLLLFRILLIV